MGSKNNTNKETVKQPVVPHRRYIYRGICTGILLFTAMTLFLCIWLLFIFEHNHTGYLLGLGNLGIGKWNNRDNHSILSDFSGFPVLRKRIILGCPAY